MTTRHLALIIISALLGAIHTSPATGEVPVVEPELRFADDRFGGRCGLLTERPIVNAGEEFDCIVEFQCEEGDDVVFLPNLGRVLQLLVFEADGAFVGEVRPVAEESGRTKTSQADSTLGADEAEHVVRLFGGRSLGVRLRIPTRRAPSGGGSEGKTADAPLVLDPGKYRIQGVVSSRLLANPVRRDAERKDEPRVTVIARSAALTLEVVPSDAPAPTAPLVDRGLSARIFSDVQKIGVGVDYHVQLRVVNESARPLRVYNPLLDSSLSGMPGRLLLYDADGKIVTDYLEPPYQRSVRSRPAWFVLPPGTVIGLRKHLKGCQISPSRSFDEGIYALQFRFHELAASQPLLAESRKLRLEFAAPE
jgi:hypothetical protein